MSVLYRSMYQEEFSSPGRVKRTKPRPTSAHRKNNPQPRPDFLFPVSLQSGSGRRPLVVDGGRTALPPIVASVSPPAVPAGVCTEERGTQLNMPPVPVLLRTARTTANITANITANTTANTAAATAGNKTTRSLSVVCVRPHTVARQRALSSSSLDYGGCCSCFHRVKSFQSGHYTIHPEFVSEHFY